MYTFRECVACMAMVFTLNALLFGLCLALLTIEWGIESLVRWSGQIQQSRSRFFSPSAAVDAWYRTVVDEWDALYEWYLKRGASMFYRSPVLVASSDRMIRDNRAQSLRHSLR